MDTRSAAAPDPAAIVVGVDGSAASLAALAWAAAEAAVHAAPLVVVHVLDPRTGRAPYAPAASPRVLRDPASIKELVERLSDGRAEHFFEVGVPSRVLVSRSAGARMLVLGQAGHRRAAPQAETGPSAGLGPTARACLAHAECPVLMVPARAERTADGRCAGRTAAGNSPAERAEPAAPPLGARAIYPRPQAIRVAHH